MITYAELYRYWCEESNRLKEILPIQKLPACPFSVIKSFDKEDDSTFSINLNPEQIEEFKNCKFIEGDYVVVPEFNEKEEECQSQVNKP